MENSFRQYGASLGGPVIKNRLFYFFSYKGIHNRSDTPHTGYVETPQYRQAVLSLRPDSITSQVLNSPGVGPRMISVIPIGCSATFAAGACQQVSGGLDLGSITGVRGAYTTGTGGGLDGVLTPCLGFLPFRPVRREISTTGVSISRTAAIRSPRAPV